MAKDYGDTSIKTLDPVTHIRMRPGMYVGEPGTGHEHMLEIGTSETGAVQIVCNSNRDRAEHTVVRLLPAPVPNPPVEVLPPPDYAVAQEVAARGSERL